MSGKHIYPNCVEWSWNRTCGDCGGSIPVGTQHTQVIDADQGHTHLPHEMPIHYFHPRCAPLTPAEQEIPGALT